MPDPTTTSSAPPLPVVVDVTPRLPTDATWWERRRLEGSWRYAVPAGLAIWIVRRRAAWRWRRDPELRADSRARMAAILTGTPRAAEVEALARAAVLEDAAYQELFRRPRQLTRGRRFTGREHFVAAAESGRGVLVSYCHLGPFDGATLGAVRDGTPGWLFSGPYIADPPGAGMQGRLVERWRRIAHAAGSRLVVVGQESINAGVELLRRGEVVLLLFDMPGRTVTPWLGKPVDLPTGTARMVHTSGALVVPMWSRRIGGRPHTAFLPPLDPRDYDSMEALHRALAAVHERLVLETPEALEDPRRPGAWEAGATPTAWTNPRPPSGQS